MIMCHDDNPLILSCGEYKEGHSYVTKKEIDLTKVNKEVCNRCPNRNCFFWRDTAGITIRITSPDMIK